MLKINVEDGKAEIKATGTLGDITGEFFHVVKELKEKIAENNPHNDFVFTAAVISAVLGVDEDTAIGTIKEVVAEKKREKADDEDDDETDADVDEDDDEDEDDDDDDLGFDMDAFIKELEKTL